MNLFPFTNTKSKEQWRWRNSNLVNLTWFRTVSDKWKFLLPYLCLLDCKEIQSVHSKGNQSWILIGRTDAEAETPIFWPPDAKNWLIWKDPDAGKNGRQEEKGMTEDEMVGWHHRLNAHEFGWNLGVGGGQGGLACCNSLGRKESDTTERLYWTELTTWVSFYFCISYCWVKKVCFYS